MRDPTFYAILEISAHADREDIRRAYRRQAQRWHPDRHGGTVEANARFVRIQKAYETLWDPLRRQEYDESLLVAEGSAGPAAPRSPPPAGPAHAPAFSGGRVDHLKIRHRVPLSILMEGGQVRVRGWVGQPCPYCQWGCRRCGYAGQILVSRQWVVEVPPGHRPDQWLRFRGVGHEGPYFSAPGDVFLALEPKRRHGWHWSAERHRLERQVRAPKGFLRAGGRLRLRAPSGKWGEIEVPAGLTRDHWIAVQREGLGPPGAPLPAWIRITVGLWFSFGTRRSRRG